MTEAREKGSEFEARLDALFHELVGYRWISEIDPEELKQLDEQALMEFAMELREKESEIARLMGPLAGMMARLKADRDSAKTQISLVQSVLRTLRNV